MARFSHYRYLKWGKNTALPPAVWVLLAGYRYISLITMIGSVLAGGSVGVVLFLAANGYNAGINVQPLISIMLPLGLVAALIDWFFPNVCQWRLKRILVENDFELCSVCGYCLRGKKEDHPCPECGSNRTRQEHLDAWRSCFPEGKLNID